VNPAGQGGTWDRPLWRSLLPIGRDERTGGYRRFSFTPEGQACRDWFLVAAAERGLFAEADQNGNLWAWWRPAAATDAEAGAIVTGSHLDSVPDGGGFDGPLGVASAFLAIDVLAERGLAPVRPIGVVAFAEEEGARFGTACLGSRLLTGAVTPDAALALADEEGVRLGDAMAAAGLSPQAIGADPLRVGRIALFVELHIEQGSALAGLGAAVGVGSSIWPHGRWRIDFTGRADHAGTTRLADRQDPMLAYAATVLEARVAAAELAALATFGKVVAIPGASNAIASAVHAWLDARAPDGGRLSALVDRVIGAAEQAAMEQGVQVSHRRESFSPLVEFDAALRGQVVAALRTMGLTAPELGTGAGHDAGVLAAAVPSAMLFVRNRTGVSHSPAEHAEPADCEAGVAALAAVLEEFACR